MPGGWRGVAVLVSAVALAAACGTGDGPPAVPPVSTIPVVPARPAVPGPDRLAGVLGPAVPQAGPGAFDVVPGSAPAPARASTTAVRVEVERGLRVDDGAFAAFVLDTLNDPRSWGRDGGGTGFARTDRDAPIQVLLATPATTDRLCGDLDTRGTLSCRRGPRAVLNLARWVTAIPDYGADRTSYRRYMVNHEVGHVLGHGHVTCPGPGRPAPVMQQQTLGLKGCRPNPWPYP